MSINILIGSVIAFIGGTCAFLFRHTLKSIFIDPSSNPKLFFENGQTKLSIHVCDIATLQNSTETTIRTQMMEERKKYATRSLDPYQNPMLVFADVSFSAKMLNSCKKLYLDSKEDYLRNTLDSEIAKSRWHPVDIYIVNKGSIATKQMRIIMRTTGALYNSTKIEIKSGICYRPPTGAEHFDRRVIVTPDFYLDQFDYEYITATDEEPIRNDVVYDIETPVRQGINNRFKLGTFYIDTSMATSIDVEWEIYEDTLGKSGNHGVLKIECQAS